MTERRPRWWAVAHATAVPPDRPIGRLIGTEPIVLFRDGTDSIRALEDQCAHRRAPLSLGQRTADGLIQCPYHGWRYDGGSGQCRAIPNLSAAERVPRSYGVRPYPVHVAGGMVHVWDGPAADPITANPAALASSAHGIDGGDRSETLLPCPHGMYASLILDRPGVVLAIDGITILDDFRSGDPAIVGDRVTSAFGGTNARRTGRLPANPPYILTISVEAGTAACRIEAEDEAGEIVARACIAAVPHGDMLTRLIVTSSTIGGKPAIRARATLDAGEIARTRQAALPEWLRLSAAH